MPDLVSFKQFILLSEAFQFAVPKKLTNSQAYDLIVYLDDKLSRSKIPHQRLEISSKQRILLAKMLKNIKA